MKRQILFLIATVLCSFVMKAQNTATVQPKIMVVPYVKEGEDIRQVIESDPNIRVVLSKIREAFDNRGFTTVDFETRLKAQSINNALAQGAQQDLKSMVVQGSGADIYVETEYQLSESPAGNSVKVLMKACDVSTGNSLANKDAFSGQFYTNDVGRLAGVAVEKVADDFLNVIQMKFSDIVAHGRSISLSFKVDESSAVTMTQDVGGEELADKLMDWVADHAYQNNYHVQGSSDLEIIFDDVRIPLYDANGRNYNIQQFDRELRQYLRSLGFQIGHVTKNNTLVVTFK